MPTSMRDLTHAINHWIASNGIKDDDVHVTIKFSNIKNAMAAQSSIAKEVRELTFGQVKQDVAGPLTMNGIGLSLDYQR